MIIPISIVIPYKNINNSIHLWTQIRETKDEFENLREFPGGKIEGNETPEIAGVREVKEEVGVDIKAENLVKFKNYDFSLGTKKILLMTFLIEDISEVFESSEYFELNKFKDLSEQIPPKNVEIIEDLIQYFR